MECKTARLLLTFASAHRSELGDGDLADLERHLGTCPECDAVARDERRLDEHLGRAVNDVRVPAGLRDQIVSRLDATDRAAARRRLLQRGGVLAAAAALLLAVAAGFYWRNMRPIPVDLTGAWEDAHTYYVSPPGPEQIEEDFRRMGVDTVAPIGLNYAFLAYHGLTDFQGRRVPELIFIGSESRAHAQVRILSRRQFDLRSVPISYRSDPGYRCKVEVLPSNSSTHAYLVSYTGENLDWLLSNPGATTYE